MSDTELKPCPCCGGKAYIQHFATGGNYEWYVVECTDCALQQPHHIYETEKEAIEAWNIRKHMERIVKQLEELPHGKYIDDYGTGFSNAVNAAIEIVQKGGAE